MSPRAVLFLAGLLGAVGVTVGAYHAHGLEKALTKRGLDPSELQRQLNNCGIAVRYTMYHALALLGIGLLKLCNTSKLLSFSVSAILTGWLLFCGGLFAMVAGFNQHWAIVPTGGLALIVGWSCLAFAGLQFGHPNVEEA